MTQDELVDMARRAGAEIYGHPDYATICVNGKDASDFVKAFAKLVAEAEREDIIDLIAMYGGPVDLEAEIRARGEA